MPAGTILWPGFGCGCPVLNVQATIKAGAAALGGIAEFGEQSTPPVFYRQFSTSGDGWTWDKYDPLAGHAHVSQVSFSSIGLSAWAFDPATGWPPSVTTESDCTVTTVTYAPYFGAGTVTGHPLVENDIPDFLSAFGDHSPSGEIASSLFDHFTGQPFWDMDFEILSKTSAMFSMAASPPGDDTITAGSIVYTLSDPDTEADAVDRFIATSSSSTITRGPAVSDMFSAGIYSLQETRSLTAGRNFGVSKGTYQVIGSLGLAGILYHIAVVWEQRDAVGDGSGDDSEYGSSWTTFGVDSFDARADSDGNFTGEITNIPAAAGKQIRIKSITAMPIAG